MVDDKELLFINYLNKDNNHYFIPNVLLIKFIVDIIKKIKEPK